LAVTPRRRQEDARVCRERALGSDVRSLKQRPAPARTRPSANAALFPLLPRTALGLTVAACGGVACCKPGAAACSAHGLGPGGGFVCTRTRACGTPPLQRAS